MMTELARPRLPPLPHEARNEGDTWEELTQEELVREIDQLVEQFGKDFLAEYESRIKVRKEQETAEDA